MMARGPRPSVMLASLVVLALLAAACRSEQVAAPTTVPPSDHPMTTTTVPPPAPAYRIGLVAPLTTDNWWSALDTENLPQNLAVLTNMGTALYTLSLPGFTHIPNMSATEFPARAFRQGDGWVVDQAIHTDREWSDGQPITAEDLVLYFETVRDLGLGGAHSAYFPPEVVSVSAPDEYTVRVVFATRPGLASWPSGVGFAPFIPAHYWTGHIEAARQAADSRVDSLTDQVVVEAIVASSAADGENVDPALVTPEAIIAYRSQHWAETARGHLYSLRDTRPPSAGALVFDGWDPGVEARARVNQQYPHRGTVLTLYSDGTVGLARPGADEVRYGSGASEEVLSSYEEGPFVSEVIWVESDDRETAYRRLVDGEVDFVLDPAGLAGGIDHALRQELDLDPSVRLITSQASGFRFLAFNMRKPPMSDPVFRRAVATIIDKEMLSDVVLGGAVIPAYEVVHPDLGAHHDPDLPRQGWSSGDPLDQGSRFEEAVTILEEAGYTWTVPPIVLRDDDNGFVDVVGGRGLRMPNGNAVPPLEILAPGTAHDPLRSTFGIWVERWLRDLGVAATTEMLGFDQLQQAVLPPQTRASALEWDMVILGWQGSDPALPGSLLVTLFHSGEDTLVFGGLNLGGYASARFDALADAFSETRDLEAAAALTRDMELVVAEDLPYVVLFRAAITEAYRARVTLPVPGLMGGHQGYPNGWPHAVVIDESGR